MYSLSKCENFLESLGFAVYKTEHFLKINFDVDDQNFYIDDFIALLNNEEDIAYAEIKINDSYNAEHIALAELLINNRDKFVADYDLDKCVEYLKSLGYEVDEENCIRIGRLYWGIEYLVQSLNDNSISKCDDDFKLLARLLEHNKKNLLGE